LHIINHRCYLGTTRSESKIDGLLTASRPVFNRNTFNDITKSAEENQRRSLADIMNSLLTTIILALPLSALTWADDNVSVALPECTATLERRTVEPNVLIVRNGCPLSLPSLSKLLESGFQGLFTDNSLPIRGIYLGRLMDYPEWSQDLAKTAAKSPTWSSKSGRPTKAGESDNRRVRLLLNGQAYPPSLKPLFAKYQVTACIGDVEKVLVFKAKDIWFDKIPIPNGISAEARLPVDAQIWLRLQPASTDCTDK